MMFSKTSLVGALALASQAAAHGYVKNLNVDGKDFGGYLVDKYPYTDKKPDTIGWSNAATDLGFVDGSGYSSGDIICHKEGQPGSTSANVAAGGTVKWDWTEWPESHHGPVITYMANCNGDCTNVDKSSLKFFKIEEAGLIDGSSAPGKWASDKLISNGNTWEVTVPSSLAAGNYVMRHEIIGLHSAGNENGAQNYPQCINLKVTGGGSDNPEGTLGTALYTPTDPGIKVSIYESLDNYQIPGPALYKAGDSGNNDPQPSPTNPEEPPTTTEPSTPPATTTSPGTSGFSLPKNLSYNQLLAVLREVTDRLFTTKRHARDMSTRR
ncbi:hypothetical protein FQN54_008951 [Arachnomyces sp. PD_36]|nr:hypothetical protein FQN54_008951 [Arachnomyces sp. PD_36]